jgi:hypothetical protein
MQEIKIVKQLFYTARINVLPDDGPEVSETCRSLVFLNILL